MERPAASRIKNRGKSLFASIFHATSYVKRQNLNIRMGLRKLTRQTNAFSKKLENHLHSLALYFVYYNFVRIHKTLRMSRAMAAGIVDKLWSVEDTVRLIEGYEDRKRQSAKKNGNK